MPPEAQFQMLSLDDHLSMILGKAGARKFIWALTTPLAFKEKYDKGKTNSVYDDQIH